MPVPKGYKRPVQIVELIVGELVTEAHVEAVKLSLRLGQSVAAKMGTHSPDFAEGEPKPDDEDSIILEARPT